ncbi:MAG TPA: hypothetical protein VFW90_02180 [Candidatus Saccharimonadales bacterium]|nr:hypothetical protein [Candidatus Saccharimonadales bacterium]
MDRQEALDVLKANLIDVGCEDHRPPELIVAELGLGQLASEQQITGPLEFVGIVDSGTYNEEDAEREGLVVTPHAFGQRVYRLLQT